MAKTDKVEKTFQLAVESFIREYRNECLYLKLEIAKKNKRIKEPFKLLDGKGSEDEEL